MTVKKKPTIKKAPGAKTVKKPIQKAAPKDASIFKETPMSVFRIKGTANHFTLEKTNKKTKEKIRVLTSGGTTLEAFNRVCELYFKN